MNIARLTSDTVGQYRDLMLRAYAEVPDAFTATVEERAGKPLSWWAKRFDDSEGLAESFGAFIEDELVGAVALEYSDRPKSKHKARIIGMYVAPDARKSGVARELLSSALAAADARPELRSITLTVTEGNDPAIALYQRHGFVQFGVEPMAIASGKKYLSKVHMWRPARQILGEA